ncbi:polysaccharide pyruvyl transferase family protein [Dyadobacter luticola]|uniref:Polysaccharide pyruvyl transferase domain-containing protein n=1 Tax=Dyadobacter luticola TaxID=1979387 RepID=A0A5R9L209_9BACT|nr:polysaccharide pyruvyl transferase family protein [Dyadobacter luticola]TLV02389.1 hypothetical protein FEN17_01760 [Dyadobacter luticola]
MNFFKDLKSEVKETGFYTLFFLTFLRVKLREIFIKPSKDPVKKLVWFGAYGNTNIGDDLIYFSLKQYIPEHVKISLSCRQHTPTTNYGVDTFYRWDKTQIMNEIKSGDFVFLGGGGLFEYYRKLHKNKVTRNVPSYLYTLLYARLNGKRYAIVGLGADKDPYPNFILRKVFGDVARHAEFIITRDQKSYNGFLKNGGKPENLISNYDPVFSLPASIDTTDVESVSRLTTVAFLIWPFHLHPFFHRVEGMDEIRKHISAEKLEKYKQFCVEMKKTFALLKEAGIKSIFPVFHFSDKILLDELGCEYEEEITFDTYFSQLKQCDLVVSMRYHGQITTILNDIPLVSIPVQEKMTALVENFQLEPYSIDIENFNGEQAVKVIKNVLENKEAIKAHVNVSFNKISKDVKKVYGETIANFLASPEKSS